MRDIRAEQRGNMQSHLARVGSVAAVGGALLLMITTFLHPVGADPSVAAAAALQAVDGVALKLVVDRWAQASGEARALAFEAAFPVRQVEIGFASLLSLIFGLTVSVFGIALLLSPRFASWSGWLGLVSGGGTVAAGIAQAYTGFSSLAMSMSMPASLLLLIGTIVIGVRLWRLAPELRRTEGDAPSAS